MARHGIWAIGLCFSTGCLWHTTAPQEAQLPPPAPPAKLVRAEPPPLKEIAPYTIRPASAIEPPPPEAVGAVEVPKPVETPPPSLPPLPKEKPLLAALRQVLENHPEEAARELAKHGAKRERLLALLKLTADVSEGDLEKLLPGEAAALLDHLREVGRAVSRRAPLELRRLAYCRSIRGFGQYEAAGAPSFAAGAEGQPGEAVQVYAEVANFGSKASADGHETRISASVEVRGKDGQRLAAVPLGDCADRCGSPRQDYFLNCRFHVPAGMKPGDHVLVVTVKDATEGKPREAQATLPFKVVTPGR
ncbi:MAG: hypothetical protein K2W96_07960 [Gemmataceae bacterium]|nr:hypothetical protein [Gemmataceae bacterium]